MLHSIDNEAHERGAAMARAVQTCIHCGFCLPTCPTYSVLGQESDSPRGRIFLMKEVLEGKLEAEQAQPHVDRCLGCLACETSCPSGVKYSELLNPYRAIHPTNTATPGARLRRWLVAMTLPNPRRFRAALRIGRFGRKFRPIIPSSLRPMLEMVPDRLPVATPLPSTTPALGPQRARVALLSGCAQQVLEPDINAAAIRVLSRNGVEVIVPPSQGCCGALAWHIGDQRRALKAAKRNLNAFPKDVDAIVTTASGCGSALGDYPLMLSGTPLETSAQEFAKRTIDISRFLADLEIIGPPPLVKPLRVAYHDACHLAHAQGVRGEPRQLLGKVPGLELIPLVDSETCCGSAGTYNIDQPEIAAELGRQKAQRIADSNCEMVAMGNIGCLVQIGRHLQEIDSKVTALHTIQILDRAYRAEI